MSTVTPSNKKTSFNKDCVKALTRSIVILKLVNESDLQELANRIREIVNTSHANGAVDVAMLVTETDPHTFPLDDFYSHKFQSELARNLPVKIGYVFFRYEDAVHTLAPEYLHYLRKWENKQGSVAA